VLVDGPVHVPPDAVAFEIGFVDKPPITRRVPGEPGRIRQQRREALHPPVHGDVIDLDPAFGQQLFNVTVRQTSHETFCQAASC
jgi:hypothetical protein